MNGIRPIHHSTAAHGAPTRVPASALLSALSFALTVALMATAGDVIAQPPPNPPNPEDVADSGQKPWDVGVSDDTKEKARKLFATGAALHKQLRIAEAVAAYREALTHWDHPNIHFNLTQALIELEQPLDAYKSLQQATRYGPASMILRDRIRASEYRKLLEGQLVKLTITCDPTDANVLLDDQVVPMSGGSHVRWVRPGYHRLVAEKPDHRADSRDLQLLPGEPHTVELAPTPRSHLAVLTVTCQETDATVTMNNDLLLSCPGERTQEVMPEAAYEVSITRPDHMPETRTLTPKPGERVSVDLRTQTLDVQTKLRWRRWQPLAVVGAGVALGVVGGVLQNRAVSNMESYDSQIDTLCGSPQNGCPRANLPQDLLDRKDQAVQQNRTGIGLMIAGGVTLAAGITWVYLNKPRGKGVAKPSPVAHSRGSIPTPTKAPTWTPTVSANGAGVSARFSF